MAVTKHRHERDSFISSASEFCRLYEGARDLGGERFLDSLVGVLPRLYAAGVDLSYPDDADEIPDDDLDVGITGGEIQGIVSSVGEVLGEIDWDSIRDELAGSMTEEKVGEALAYIEQSREANPDWFDDASWNAIRENVGSLMPDPRSLPRAAPLPHELLLYDDLHDTYRDLKEGFRLLDAGRPEAEAVFSWHLSFWSHWGYHVTNALRVIHHYVAAYGRRHGAG